MIALNENQRYTNSTLAKSNVGIGVLDYVWRTAAIRAVFLCPNSLLLWVGYAWCSNARWFYLRTSSTPTCIVLPATIGVVAVGSKKSIKGDSMLLQSTVTPVTLQSFRNCITDIDSLSQENLSRIASIAKLAKTCLESGNHALIEDVACALSVIQYIATTTADDVNSSAESVGCNYKGE